MSLDENVVQIPPENPTIRVISPNGAVSEEANRAADLPNGENVGDPKGAEGEIRPPTQPAPTKPPSRGKTAEQPENSEVPANAEEQPANANPAEQRAPTDSDCPYSVFGCDVEAPNHEQKRPVKHMTLLSDSVLASFGQTAELSAAEDGFLRRFSLQKLTINSIICRESVQLLWKIDHFNEESRRAKVGLATAPLQSELFATDEFGYNMRALIAPYGHAEAFGEAMGFHVRLEAGDYDPILRWPFDMKVMLTLYDQNPDVTRRLDYRYELIPGDKGIMNGAYVGRPEANHPNEPIGVEAFVELDKMYDGTYIVEGAIIVGVYVSF